MAIKDSLVLTKGAVAVCAVWLWHIEATGWLAVVCALYAAVVIHNLRVARR